MDRKLTAGIFNDSFPPVIDGVSNVALNYAEIINRKLGSALVATPSYPDVTDSYPFPVIRYPSLNTEKLVGYRAGVPILPSTVTEIKKHKIDIIHAHCPVMSMLLARNVRTVIDVPVVFTYHTKFDIDIANAIDVGFLQDVAIKSIVTNIEAADEVWVVSQGAGENLKSLGYTGDYTVMPNGVEYPRGRVDSGETAKVSAKWGLPDDEPVFLFVGRMMWYKGIRTILDGLFRAKAAGASFKMLFVGSGGNFDEIKAYSAALGLKSDCIFTGAIHDREILRSYFCRADMFLFPSTFDTNGIVVREAAACSLGSVLVRGSCAAEGVTDGVNGILIDDSSDAMAKAVTEVCQNRQRARDIGAHAMNELYLSWEDSVTMAYERYYGVIERYRSGGHRRHLIDPLAARLYDTMLLL